MPLALTWRNNRSGSVGISNFLGTFLLAKMLVVSCDHYISWIGSRGLLDHNPICLQLECEDEKPQSHSNLIMVGYSMDFFGG